MESFRSYLPSKFFGLILGALALVGLLISLAYFWPAKEKEVPFFVSEDRAKETLTELAKVAAEKDTDGDGLRDWEESLWGTSVNTADTDGDGTKDGEEARSSRNPTVKGPNDAITESPIEAFPSSASLSEDTPVTATEKISREILSNYLIAIQSGEEVTEETFTALVASSLQKENSLSFQRLYGRGDLLITEDSSKERLKRYGDEIGEIIIKNATWEESELDIISRAAEGRNGEELEKLRPIIEGYRKILTALSATEVPNEAVTLHLAFLNRFSGMLFIVEKNINLFQDPASAALAFGKITEEGYGLYQAFQGASTLLSNKGITYKITEPGFLLSNYSAAIDAAR